jgi:hypothetical protein
MSLTRLLNFFIHNQVPDDIRSTFAAQYVIALHKDPQNLDKIRPIGIGTALRRLAAAASITLHGHTLASYLIPHGQLGIHVPGGLDFIVHSTQAQLNTYMTQEHPTRALLTLDIANMFNAISRQACRHTLLKEPTLQPLVPFFDLLYHNYNECWYNTPNHDYQCFPQHEGFTQGCPLSGAFADVVLTLVLQPLNIQLRERTHDRNPNELPPSTLSYHDNTSIVIPYPDITWFLTTFQTLGTPLGIHLNLSKTQLLTSLTTDPPCLSPNDQQHLSYILQTLPNSVEHHHGLCLLGQPVGSATFATQYIVDHTTRLHHIVTQQLFHRIHDHQTQLALLKHCAIPSIMHLLATHLYHLHTPNMTTDISQWDSESTLAIRITIHHAIATITQQTTLPYHTIPIIHLPATLGGLGIRDPITSTIPAYITTVACSIRYATHGITINNIPHELAPIHQQTILHDRYNTILQHYAPTFLPLVPRSTASNLPPLTLHEFLKDTPLPGLQCHLYHHHQTTIHQNISLHMPTHIHAILPSLLTPLISLPLCSMSQRIPTNHFTNDELRILLQRKLRLPIFSPSHHHQHCICHAKSILDPFGDHLFSCTLASKTPIHNYLRDTIYHILAKLVGPLANIVRTSADVLIEPPTLLPTHPTLHPADIGLHILPPPNYHSSQTPTPYLAIDVTFPHVPNCFPPNPVPPASNPTHQVHNDSAKQKYNVPHAHQLLTHNIALLPFTIDHLGGIGHQATQFLFGTEEKRYLLSSDLTDAFGLT